MSGMFGVSGVLVKAKSHAIDDVDSFGDAGVGSDFRAEPDERDGEEE